MPRRANIDRLLAFINTLASTTEQALEDFAEIMPALERLSRSYGSLEPYKLSITMRTRRHGGRSYEYRVLRVQKESAGFIDGYVFEVHVTNAEDLASLASRLNEVRNQIIYWAGVTSSLLSSLEEAKRLLQEYQRLVSRTGSGGKQAVAEVAGGD